MIQNRLYLVILFYIFRILLISAQDSLLYKPLTITDTTCPVISALQIIEQKTGLSLSYNTSLFNQTRIIKLRAEKEPLISVLKRVIDDTSLEFSVIGKHLIVYQPIRSPAANPVNRSDSIYYFEIRGRVLDRMDRQPIPFANIYIEGKSKGIISNTDGQFVFKLDSKYIGDTLQISCVGYQIYKAPVSSLINSNRDYYLQYDVISIQEVIIRKLSPVNVLRTANSRIGVNYQTEPAVLSAFYRETIKKGNRFTMVSEAILEEYKPGYSTISSDQVKILKGRKTENADPADTIMLKLKAGLNTMILLDVVKDIPDFLTGRNELDYGYRMADIVFDNGSNSYAIEFYPKEKTGDIIYSGRILVGIEDMAIREVEFYVDNDQLELATNRYIIKKPAYIQVKVQKAGYRIRYRKLGDRYFLNLIQCETEYKIRNRHQINGSVFNSTLEMVVTEIDTATAIRFPVKETAQKDAFFVDQLGVYDETFWGEYNFVTPDESLEHAILRINKVQIKKTDEP
jgi:hypothetical protein